MLVPAPRHGLLRAVFWDAHLYIRLQSVGGNHSGEGRIEGHLLLARRGVRRGQSTAGREKAALHTWRGPAVRHGSSCAQNIMKKLSFWPNGFWARFVDLSSFQLSHLLQIDLMLLSDQMTSCLTFVSAR